MHAPELQTLVAQMLAGLAPKTVLLHGIDHHVEENAMLDQLVDEGVGVLRMDVVVVSS